MLTAAAAAVEIRESAMARRAALRLSGSLASRFGTDHR
jgi:hypothetical protein